MYMCIYIQVYVYIYTGILVDPYSIRVPTNVPQSRVTPC